MNSIELLSVIYNNRSISRSYILSRHSNPEELFDFNKKIFMDDLSYLSPRNEELFKTAVKARLISKEPKLIVEFEYGGQTYTNELCCFSSNI